MVHGDISCMDGMEDPMSLIGLIVHDPYPVTATVKRSLQEALNDHPGCKGNLQDIAGYPA